MTETQLSQNDMIQLSLSTYNYVRSYNLQGQYRDSQNIASARIGMHLLYAIGFNWNHRKIIHHIFYFWRELYVEILYALKANS